MERALYGPDGFYTRGGQAGRRGDFLTSPEVGPLFGAVLARFLDAEWERLGRPAPFTVVDAGAGPGTLARSIVAAAPECRAVLRYIAVEVAEVQRRDHPPGVESRADVPADPFVGVVIANELLDNLPFRLAVFDGAWREAFVDRDDGRHPHRGVVGAVRPACRPSCRRRRRSAPGRRSSTPPAPGWMAPVAWSRSGSVIAFDYAVDTTAELAVRPWREWLRTYRRHERGGHYLAAPGEQDLTTDVPLDQLPAPDERWTQAEFLRQWGIGGARRGGAARLGRRRGAAGSRRADHAQPGP